MKNTALAILFVVTFALAALFLRESHKTSVADAKISTLQKDLEDTQAQLQQQETRANSLQTRLKDARERVVAKADEVTHLQQAITNAETGEKSPVTEMFKGVGEMFKNPEMKEFVKNQQKTVLSGMLDKNYAAFFSQLGLTSEQSAALKDLILNKSLVDAGAGMAMMTEAATNRPHILEEAKKEKAAVDEQIRQMLGDENYSQFQTYEKSIPDRMVVGMFRDQQASGPGALTPEQEAQLIQFMNQERQSFKFTTDFSDPNRVSSDLAGNFTKEKMEQFLVEQEDLYQRYLGRAQGILSAEQYAAYEKFLSSQRQMQKLGLDLASKMFTNQKGK